jgi:hypothetical protein
MSDNPDSASPVEVIPSRTDGISAIASAHAPFLYFDHAPNFGFNQGIVNVTLEAFRFLSGSPTLTRDRVVVAHLRMSIPAAMSLRSALDGALLIAAPAAAPQTPPVAGSSKPN